MIKRNNLLIMITVLAYSILYTCFIYSASIPVEKDQVHYNLDNGLTVILKNIRNEDRVTITVGYRFGAAYDVKGKSGLAHFTYMLADRVISNQYSNLYNKILEPAKTAYYPEFGRDVVLFTTICSKEDVDTVLTIEAQRMALKNFDPLQFEAVKRLKMAEFLKGTAEQPDNKIKFLLRGAIMNFWEYYHLYHGSKIDVQIARVQDIQRFLEWYYSPDNGVLVISGPIDTNALKKRIKEVFDPLEKSEVEPITFNSFSIGIRTHHLKYENKQLRNPAIGFSYGIPSITHKNYPALKLIYYILLNGKDSRLGYYAEKASSVRDYYQTLYRNGGANIFGAIFYLPDKAYFESMKDYFFKQVEDVNEGKIKDSEFNTAKRKLLRENAESLNARNYTSTLAKLSLIFPKIEDVNKYYASYTNITKQDVLKIANEYLIIKNMCILYCVKSAGTFDF